MSNVVFFDGVDDYVSVANHATLQMANDITIECVFKNNQPLIVSGGGYCGLVSKGLASLAGAEYSLWISDVTASGLLPYLWIRKPDNLSSENLAANVLLTRNVWSQVVGVHSGNWLYIYVNGTLRGSKNIGWPGQFVANNNVNIHAGVDHLYSGIGANARIYNRALSDSEVLYNFQHPNNPIKRGIQLNLTQDSILGAQWQDLSGNGNHGTYTGGAVPQVANSLCGR